MAITRPQTDTIISTVNWGIPITDQVNANTTDIAAMKPGAWTTIALLNGAVVNGTVAPSFRSIGGHSVQLRGNFKSSASGAVFGNIPVGFRPVVAAEMTAFQFNNGTWMYGSLTIAANGDMTYINPSGVSANTANFSLWNILYPIT